MGRVTMAYKWLATVTLAASLAHGQVDIKADLKKCLSDGQDLNKCLRDLADSFTPAMKIFVPNSVATGMYVITGKVAVLELDAEPPAKYKTEFKDTTIEGVAQLKVENNRLIIDGDPDITITLGGLNI